MLFIYHRLSVLTVNIGMQDHSCIDVAHSLKASFYQVYLLNQICVCVRLKNQNRPKSKRVEQKLTKNDESLYDLKSQTDV